MTTWQNPNTNKSEVKMRRYPTKVINLIGGPGSDKSFVAAAIILNLTLGKKSLEHIPDLAKSLVWQKDVEALKNQYYIAHKQYKMLKLLDGQYEYLITESSLPQLLYYNKHYKENICDVTKTENHIIEWYKEFNNINVFVERTLEKEYVETGRFQTQEQALIVDKGIIMSLTSNGIPFHRLSADLVKINDFIEKNL